MIYIALDDDAKKDAYNLSEFFKDFGIDAKVVNLPKDKDPNDYHKISEAMMDQRNKVFETNPELAKTMIITPRNKVDKEQK